MKSVSLNISCGSVAFKLDQLILVVDLLHKSGYLNISCGLWHEKGVSPYQSRVFVMKSGPYNISCVSVALKMGH